MESKIVDSCGSRGCRIIVLPCDKDLKLIYFNNFIKHSNMIYVKPINIGKNNIVTLINNK
ncbi:hypothetical protein M0Q50_10210 [bacterium]|jgi:hypothetical protein|nr:hypothetical protein [bacterium]